MLQLVKNCVLRHVRFNCEAWSGFAGFTRFMSASSSSDTSSEDVMARVVELVKKFDKLDAHKVTAMADFQKDLSLDSLDKVELVMAFEQEFSIEIPDSKAENLKCCADVADYILSESQANKGNGS